MADTLTQLIAKVQAQLQDGGTLFTTPTVTAAARHALEDLNDKSPQRATVTITALADTLEYELTDEDPLATGIIDVVLEGNNEYTVELAHYAYSLDERWFFRLRQSLLAGESIIVHYTLPHTLNGLDSATDSTLDASGNIALIAGTIYYCCLSRSAAGIESNNVEPAVAAAWLKLAEPWGTKFFGALRKLSHRPTAKTTPSSFAWNDDQHDVAYP